MTRRRQFLIGCLGLASVAALGAAGAIVYSESQIVAGIRRRLGFLKLDDAGLHRFAKDQVDALLAKRPSWYRLKYHFYSLFSRQSARWGISNDARSRRERLDDHFATIFLLSSDFFINQADESRTISYIGYYDPIRPCTNPFARPAVDPQAPRVQA